MNNNEAINKSVKALQEKTDTDGLFRDKVAVARSNEADKATGVGVSKEIKSAFYHKGEEVRSTDFDKVTGVPPKIENGFKHDDSGNSITLKNGTIVRDTPGIVKFVNAKKANSKFWDDLEIKDGYEHYTGVDRKWRADFPLAFKHFNGPLEWYGPAHEFEVTYVGPDTWWGSAIRIKFKDSSGVDNRELGFGHFTEINSEIWDAVNKKGPKLKPGTYLGAIKDKIGVTQAPHLHVAEKTEKYSRVEWIEWLKNPPIQVSGIPIPKLMKKKEWHVAAALQDKWFKGPSNNDPKKYNDFEIVKMKWVLKSRRIEKTYKDMITDKITNKFAMPVIGKQLEEDGIDGVKKKEFDYIKDVAINNNLLPEKHKKHIQHTIIEPLDDNSDLDELDAALRGFAMYALIRGTCEKEKTEEKLHVKITHVGVYIKDYFDFNHFRLLGLWSKEAPYVYNNGSKFLEYLKSHKSFDKYKLITSNDYIYYREHEVAGCDFTVWSDVEVTKLNTPKKFLIEKLTK